MTLSKLSRRDFLKGAGATGMVGALALGGAGVAFAEEGTASGEAAATANPYSQALGEDASLLPMRHAECPGPHGPVAFEDRTIGDDEIVSTADTEVLVIGAGIGGIMASLKAAEEGAKVLMIEKMTEGRSAWESFGATQATFQKEQGIVIDDAQLIDEILRASDWRADPEVVTSYVKHSGEVADFWQAMFDKTGTGWQIYKFDQAPNYNGFPVIDSYVNFKMPEGISKTWLFGLHVCEDLLKALSMYDNAEVRYECPAVQLVKEANRVTGAIAKTADGYIRINASKGVLLATGGYDANPEMMQAWVRPEDYEYSSWWNPSWGTTGDGHMMGLAVGAEMDAAPAGYELQQRHALHLRGEARVLPRRDELGHHGHRRGQALHQREQSAPVCGQRHELADPPRAHLLLHLRSGHDPKLAGQGRRGGRRAARSR